MREIQELLRQYIKGNSILSQILPAAPVLILITPLVILLDSMEYMSFYHQLEPIFYLMFWAGLFLCFALDRKIWMAVAFALLALQKLTNLVDYFSLSDLLYLVAFGGLAGYFFWLIAKTPNGNVHIPQDNWEKDTGAAVPRGGYCPNCGAPVEPNGRFCPVCATPYTSYERGPLDDSDNSSEGAENSRGAIGKTPISHPTPPRVDLTEAATRLSQTCGGVLCLVFACILTTKILLDVLAGFSIVALIGNIPMIILCVAVWMLYVNGRSYQLQGKEFRIVRAAFLVQLIFSMIPYALILIALVAVSSIIGDVDGMGGILFGAVLVCVIGIVLQIAFYRGMQRTTDSASAVLLGNGEQVDVSMYCVVLLFLQAGLSLIGFMLLMQMQQITGSWLAQILDAVSSQAYLYGDNGLNEVLQFFLPSGGQAQELATLSELLAVAMPIVGGILLLKMKSKQPVYY